MRTANLRRQHDGALALVAEIMAATRGAMGPGDRAAGMAISGALAKLTGLLKVHFAQEDGALYPSLVRSARPEVASVAQRFVTEMGQLGPVYLAFADRWMRSDAILSDLPGFRAAASTVFGALGDRIARENEILYPLADAQDHLDRARSAAA